MRKQKLFSFLMILILVVAGCGSKDVYSGDNLGGGLLTVEDLPATLGRGFPKGIRIANVPASSVDAGELAPDFRLVLADGSSLALSDLKGRPVLINFWATWCPPCRREMPDIIDRYNQNADDLVVLAINTREGLDLVEPFAESYEITMPVVLDQAGDIMRLYEVNSMPTSYFIDRDGRIVMRWVGLMSPDILDSFLKIIL